MLITDSCAVIAHRGASGLCGEDNTLAAFRRAIAVGCDFAETDLRLTADKKIICFHDHAFADTTIADWRYDELCAATGLNIPSLEELLAFCEGKIGLDLELKEAGYEAEIISCIHRFDYNKDTLILKSFELDAMQALRQCEHDFPVGLLIDQKAPEQDFATAINIMAEQATELGVNFISPHKSFICAELWLNERIKEFPILPWTVNSADDIATCCAFPIAGIISDRPDRCRTQLQVPAKQLTVADIHHCSTKGNAADLIALLNHSALKDLVIHSHDILICDNLIDELRASLQLLWPKAKNIIMVMDHGAAEAIGNTISAAFPQLTCLQLEAQDGWDHLTPHVEISQLIADQATDADALIAVGSGTVNDLCKYAAHNLNIPYIACATAASMNGYTSSIAALLIDNLKCTVPCTPPIAVLADAQVIAHAPANLTQSGYADLLSKYVSVSDWKLSEIVRGDAFNTLPSHIANRAIEDSIVVAERYADNDIDACTVLMRAIILSGYSMALAGNSAPASGGEHLISHYLDMTAYSENRSPELHGLQVALGSLLSCTLYEEIRQLDPQACHIHQITIEEKKAVHGKLWVIVEAEATKQILSEDDAKQRLQHIQNNWEIIWSELDQYLCSSANLKKHLRAAQVPCNPEHYGISRQLMRTALVHGADIRDRY
ncbi:MAG: iron-containing alcohol dehydrogenase, partial [Planctomycetes bacterium]|nr:iron-containing alcohol dehydrogenase [Planctomycetota bacterium]